MACRELSMGFNMPFQPFLSPHDRVSLLVLGTRFVSLDEYATSDRKQCGGILGELECESTQYN